MQASRPLVRTKWQLSPIIWILLTATLLTILFWTILPKRYGLTEATDYYFSYEPVARNILAGKGITLRDGEVATTFPPGYSLILAGVFGITHRLHVSEEFGLSALAISSTGLIALFIFLLGRMIWGTCVGMVSSLLWITYPFALWLTKQPNSEMPFTALLYGGLCLFWFLLKRKPSAWTPYVLCGLVLGVAMLIRPIAIAIGLVFGLIIWLVRRDASRRFRLLLISLLVLGNLVAIFPWEAWVYAKTGNVILLSKHSSSVLRVGTTFGIYDNSDRGKLSVSPDIAGVMKDIADKSGEMITLKDSVSIVAAEFRTHPIATSELFLLKAARSWYATDSRHNELPIMLIQLPYLGIALWGLGALWRRRDVDRDFAIGTMLLVIYFWAMTILALSILRYMVPVMGLLFIVMSAALVPWVQLNLFKLKAAR